MLLVLLAKSDVSSKSLYLYEPSSIHIRSNLRSFRFLSQILWKKITRFISLRLIGARLQVIDWLIDWLAGNADTDEDVVWIHSLVGSGWVGWSFGVTFPENRMSETLRNFSGNFPDMSIQSRLQIPNPLTIINQLSTQGHTLKSCLTKIVLKWYLKSLLQLRFSGCNFCPKEINTCEIAAEKIPSK